MEKTRKSYPEWGNPEPESQIWSVPCSAMIKRSFLLQLMGKDTGTQGQAVCRVRALETLSPNRYVSVRSLPSGSGNLQKRKQKECPLDMSIDALGHQKVLLHSLQLEFQEAVSHTTWVPLLLARDSSPLQMHEANIFCGWASSSAPFLVMKLFLW